MFRSSSGIHYLHGREAMICSINTNVFTLPDIDRWLNADLWVVLPQRWFFARDPRRGLNERHCLIRLHDNDDLNTVFSLCDGRCVIDVFLAQRPDIPRLLRPFDVELKVEIHFGGHLARSDNQLEYLGGCSFIDLHVTRQHLNMSYMTSFLSDFVRCTCNRRHLFASIVRATDGGEDTIRRIERDSDILTLLNDFGVDSYLHLYIMHGRRVIHPEATI